MSTKIKYFKKLYKDQNHKIQVNKIL